MSGADKNSENKVIENMTFIKQKIGEIYSSADNENNVEVKNLLNVFENLENKNIEKLEYLIKQVANFINKFENLENETILEQFEKILYSINNSRLELLEEIAKLSSGEFDLSEIKINNITPERNESASEDVSNKLLAELLEFKTSNHTNLSKVYFNLKKQLDELKQNNSFDKSDVQEDLLNNLTTNINSLKSDTSLIQQVISSQNEQLNQVLTVFNEKFKENSSLDNQHIKTNLNNLLEELSEFKKTNNLNLKNIYLHLNKKIDEIKINPEKTYTSDTKVSENLIKNLTNEIIQLKTETANNSRKISILLETFDKLNTNIDRIGFLVEKNIFSN